MKLDRRVFTASCLSAALACRRRKAEGFPGYAFVANREGKAIGVVDLGAFAAVRHVRLDDAPAALISHPRKPAVYVLTPASGAIHEVNSSELVLARRTGCPPPAPSFRLAPGGRTLWVLCDGARALARLPVAGFRPDATIPLPGGAVDFDLSPDGQHAAASFGDRGLVAVVNLTELRVEHLVDVGGSPAGVRYRKDGAIVLVGDQARRMLVLIDAASGQLLVRLPLAVRPEHFCYKADGGELFLTGAGMDAVVTVHPYQTQVASTTLAGHAPGFLAASAHPDYLFVANPDSDMVTVLNIETQRVIATVAVGRRPGYIVITPDNRYALVLNHASGDIAVIRVASLTGRRRRFAPLFTMVPVGSGPVCAVVRAV